MNDGAKEFLEPTIYCDYEDAVIKKRASEIIKRHTGNRKKATALFFWVRDHIFYRVGHWHRKASETLEEGEGTCTNKTNLLVAFLRCVGIPAGYGVMRVLGKEYFGPVVPSILKKRIGAISRHVYAVVYLNNRWIKIDPSDDWELAEKTSHYNPQSRLVHWDGEQDAVLNLDATHIIEDDWPLANIDHIISKKPRNATKIVMWTGNLYITFLRESGSDIGKNVDNLEYLFKNWLKKNNKLHYCLFSLSSLWHDLKNKINNEKKS